MTTRTGPMETLRLRLRYRWDNSGSRAMNLAQRALAAAQVRRAFARTATIATETGPVTIGYAGIPLGLRTILPLTEQLAPGGSEQVSRSDVRRGNVHELCAGLARTADIVIVGGQRPALAAAGLHVPHVDAPFRVHLVRDIPADPDELMAQVSRRDRHAFRKDLRDHGFELEVTRDGAELARFYEGMHLPTMRRRHGSLMLSESPVVARHDLLARGLLFFVRSRGQRVAGALCAYDGARSTLTTRLLGVAGGDEQHYQSGAFKALYHLISDWCRRHGVRHLDLYAAPAWVGKGLFQWKRRLHPRVTLPPNRYRSLRVRVHVMHDREAVRDFLVATPLLTLDDSRDGLTATWFHDGRRPRRDDIKVGLPGVATERGVDLDDFMYGGDGGPRQGATPLSDVSG